MPLYPVTQQIKSYFGADGLPLNNGYVYFGGANQNPETNPVTVYWDAAGTIVAPQPLRTVGGYIVRNGTPANVFATGDFSSTVRDSKGQLVYTVPTSTDIQLALAVIGAGTAASITVADAGGYYATANVEDVLQEVGASLASVSAGVLPTGTVLDFAGGVGDGAVIAPPAGFVYASGKTIGNAASNATERNNADTAALYTLLWNVEGASGGGAGVQLPIQDSTGAPSTRGASAAADFAANKRLPLPDCRGRIRAGKDDMTLNSPFTVAGRITDAGAGIVGTTQFAAGGTQTHVLTSPGELPSHTHTQNAHTHTQNAHGHSVNDPSHAHTVGALDVLSGGQDNPGGSGTNNYNRAAATSVNAAAAFTSVTVNNNTATNQNTTATNNATGSGGAHQNTQPTIMFTVIIKL